MLSEEVMRQGSDMSGSDGKLATRFCRYVIELLSLKLAVATKVIRLVKHSLHARYSKYTISFVLKTNMQVLTFFCRLRNYSPVPLLVLLQKHHK